jgi:hypothetical protein
VGLSTGITADFGEVGRLTLVVELISVEPHPAGVRRPVVNPDHPEVDRGPELDTGVSGDLQYIPGAGQFPLARRQAGAVTSTQTGHVCLPRYAGLYRQPAAPASSTQATPCATCDCFASSVNLARCTEKTRRRTEGEYVTMSPETISGGHVGSQERYGTVMGTTYHSAADGAADNDQHNGTTYESSGAEKPPPACRCAPA